MARRITPQRFNIETNWREYINKPHRSERAGLITRPGERYFTTMDGTIVSVRTGKTVPTGKMKDYIEALGPGVEFLMIPQQDQTRRGVTALTTAVAAGTALPDHHIALFDAVWPRAVGLQPDASFYEKTRSDGGWMNRVSRAKTGVVTATATLVSRGYGQTVLRYLTPVMVKPPSFKQIDFSAHYYLQTRASYGDGYPGRHRNQPASSVVSQVVFLDRFDGTVVDTGLAPIHADTRTLSQGPIDGFSVRLDNGEQRKVSWITGGHMLPHLRALKPGDRVEVAQLPGRDLFLFSDVI